MGETTLKSLVQLLDEAIGDYLTFNTTTAITASVSVISTTLREHDGGADGYFDEWWVYIAGTANAGVLRKTGLPAATTYATATGNLYVAGTTLTPETAGTTATNVTCYLHRYNRDNKKRAINRALEQVYPALHKPLDDLTLVTGNMAWDGHFEWWPSSTTLQFWQVTNAAITTEASTIRGQLGTYAMKVTPSVANGYAYLDSAKCPWLLDLMNGEVDAYVWAYAEVTDDPTLEIHTTQVSGSTQTLASTTSASSAEFTQLKLEAQRLNNDLIAMQIRCKSASSTKYTIFDDLVVGGKHLHNYMLPKNFQDGHISQALIQTTGYSDPVCYDLNPQYWDSQEFDVYKDGTYRYLHLKDLNTNYRRINLKGIKPLSAMTADTDTIEIDGEKLNLIVAKAAAIMYRLEQGPISSEDKGRYYGEIAMWEREYTKLLPQLCMGKPAKTLWTR